MTSGANGLKKKVRGQIPQSVRFNVFRRDNFACRYCGRTSPEVLLHCDHAISVKDGGGDGEENLVTACSDCNFGKSSKSVVKPRLAVAAPIDRQDGLVGMWGHTFDEEKHIKWQFKIIRAVSSDVYMCQLFSWLDGEPTNCAPLTLSALLNDCQLYADNGQMLVAYEKECDRRRREEKW